MASMIDFLSSFVIVLLWIIGLLLLVMIPRRLRANKAISVAERLVGEGEYEHAADVLHEASTRDPNNVEMKRRSLEIYFVSGAMEQFIGAAQRFRSGLMEQEWQWVVTMGKQLSPDHRLFRDRERP